MQIDKKFTISITDNLAEGLDRIPWGLKSHVVRIVLEKILEIFLKHGTMGIAAIIDGNWEITIGSEFKDVKD